MTEVEFYKEQLTELQQRYDELKTAYLAESEYHGRYKGGFSVTELAERLGVSQKTIWDKHDKGQLKRNDNLDRVLFSREEVLRFNKTWKRGIKESKLLKLLK